MVTRKEIISFDNESRAYYKENYMNIRWLHKFSELDYTNKSECAEFFNSLLVAAYYPRKRRGRRMYMLCDDEELDEETLKKKKAYEELHKKEKGMEMTLAYVIYAYVHRYYGIPHAPACIIQQSAINDSINSALCTNQDIFLVMMVKIKDFFAIYATRNDWKDNECKEMEAANATLLDYFSKVEESIAKSTNMPVENHFPYMASHSFAFPDKKELFKFL